MADEELGLVSTVLDLEAGVALTVDPDSTPVEAVFPPAFVVGVLPAVDEVDGVTALSLAAEELVEDLDSFDVSILDVLGFATNELVDTEAIVLDCNVVGFDTTTVVSEDLVVAIKVLE